MSEAIIDAQSAKDFCEKLYQNGASIERIFIILKLLGFSQAISTFIVQTACGIEHSVAKKAAIESIAWSEFYEANIGIQNAFDEYLETQIKTTE